MIDLFESLILENMDYKQLIHTQIVKHLNKLRFESTVQLDDKMLEFIASSLNYDDADELADPDSRVRLKIFGIKDSILTAITDALSNYGMHIRSKYVKNWKEKIVGRAILNEYYDLLSATFAKGILSVQPYFDSPEETVIDLPNDNDIVIETFMNFAGGGAKMAKESGIPGINDIRAYTKGLMTNKPEFNGFRSMQENVRKYIVKEETAEANAADTEVENLLPGLLVMAKEENTDESGQKTGEAWWLYAIPSTEGKDAAAADILASAAKEVAVGLTRSGGERGGQKEVSQGSDAVWCFRNYGTALNYLKWCSLLVIYHQAIKDGVKQRAVPVHAGTLPNSDTLNNNGHLLGRLEFKDENNKSCPIPANVPAKIKTKYMDLIRKNNALLAYMTKTGSTQALPVSMIVNFIYSDPATSIGMFDKQVSGYNRAGLTTEDISLIRSKLLQPPKSISKSPYVLLISELAKSSANLRGMILGDQNLKNNPVLNQMFAVLEKLPLPRRITTRVGLGQEGTIEDSYISLSKTAEDLKERVGHFPGDVELICIAPYKLEKYALALGAEATKMESERFDTTFIKRMADRVRFLFKQMNLEKPLKYESEMLHTVPCVAGNLFNVSEKIYKGEDLAAIQRLIAEEFRDMIEKTIKVAPQDVSRNLSSKYLSLIFAEDESQTGKVISDAIVKRYLAGDRGATQLAIKNLAESNMLAEDLPIDDAAMKQNIVNKVNEYIDAYVSGTSRKATDNLFRVDVYAALRSSRQGKTS